jgi:Uma2 family endonuclease
MSTITPQAESAIPFEWVPGPLYRMSLEKFEAMVESGVFTERDKLHLIDGLLVAKMTRKDPHCTADTLCRDQLIRVIPGGWFVRSNKPVRLPPDSKPEPDQCVVRGSARDYARRSPGAADVGLLVEVADTSLDADRRMALIYGAAAIPVYWIVNLVDSQVEVYTGPTASGYGPPRIYKPGYELPVVLDGAEVGRIAVSDILP